MQLHSDLYTLPGGQRGSHIIQQPDIYKVDVWFQSVYWLFSTVSAAFFSKLLIKDRIKYGDHFYKDWRRSPLTYRNSWTLVNRI